MTWASMPPVLTAVVAAFVLLVALLVGYLHAQAHERWILWRQPRFSMRLRARGEPGALVPLGRLAPGGSVAVVGSEVVLEDEMDRAIVLLAGQRLEIEAFEGSARDDDGTFRVPAGERFWILDAPAGPDVPTDASGRLHLPARPAGYPITTAPRPLLGDAGVSAAGLASVALPMAVFAGAVADVAWPALPTASAIALGVAAIAVVARIRALDRAPTVPHDAELGSVQGSVTFCAMAAPAWANGLRGAHEWLLAPKREGAEPHVLIVSLLDPHAGQGDDARNAIVGSVCHVLAEAVWTSTDLTARAAVPMVVGRERRHLVRMARPGYEAYRGWLGNYPGKRLLVRGEALGADPGRDGYALHLRFTEPDDAEEHTLRGPLPELVPALLGWIDEHWGGRRASPAGIAEAVPADGLDAWLACLAAQERIALGKPESEMLPAPSAAEAEASIERALAAADRHGDVMPQARLLAVSMGIEIEKHGLLGEARRAYLREMIEALVSDGHPLARLAPGLLTGIGEHELGAERARAALAAMGGPYRAAADAYGAWLREIAARPDALAPKQAAPTTPTT